MALGCTVQGAIAQVSSSGIFATATGLVAGLLLSLLAVKVLQSQLFGVGLYDPVTLCSVSLVLLVVALLAAVLPAFRIARIDPADILRAE
jgi:ABC-type antimicrobial peptide transport system permease subunit